MSFPLVSILIPVYNAEKYVAETIESAINQTYKNIEIIIVDDGSTDKSWEIIESYREKYPNIIKTYKQVNKGACAARNKAFELSCGQYIQYLDADDLLAPDKIENQIKYFDGSGEDNFIVNGRWRHFFGDLFENIPWGPDKEIQMDLLPDEWIIKDKMAVSNAWLFPRNLIIKSGGWAESLAINQDGEFIWRILKDVKIVKYTPEAKVFYRKSNPNSVSSNLRKNLRKIESYYNSLHSLEQTLLQLRNDSITKRFISKKYMEFVYTFYPAEKLLTKQAMYKVKLYGNLKLAFQNKIMEFLRLLFGWKTALWVRYLIKFNTYRIGTKN